MKSKALAIALIFIVLGLGGCGSNVNNETNQLEPKQSTDNHNDSISKLLVIQYQGSTIEGDGYIIVYADSQEIGRIDSSPKGVGWAEPLLVTCQKDATIRVTWHPEKPNKNEVLCHLKLYPNEEVYYDGGDEEVWQRLWVPADSEGASATITDNDIVVE